MSYTVGLHFSVFHLIVTYMYMVPRNNVLQLHVHVQPYMDLTFNMLMYMKSGVPEPTRQRVDSCFRLVGPHQHRVCLAALLWPRLTYPRQA